jgi:hypothetical protein
LIVRARSLVHWRDAQAGQDQNAGAGGQDQQTEDHKRRQGDQKQQGEQVSSANECEPLPACLSHLRVSAI